MVVRCRSASISAAISVRYTRRSGSVMRGTQDDHGPVGAGTREPVLWSGLVQLDAWEILVPDLLRQTPPTVRAAAASKIARNGFAPTSPRSSASPLRTCGRRGS